MLGLGALAVIFMLAYQVWSHHCGRYSIYPVIAGVVPVIVLFLGMAFQQLGIIGALWCFPAVIAFYFMLPERPAWLANVMLLTVVIPHAWWLLEPGVAIRVVVTLTISSLFSAIFVRVITRQQMRLEQSEEKRREGMAGVSHELRTPLATLNAQVDAMLDGIRPLERSQLMTLSRSLEHINGLVDDLYLLALADVGELVCRKEVVRWDRIAEDAVELVEHNLAQRGITIIHQIGHPINVTGDTRRLRQILDILLENCSRYTQDNATVTVTLQCCHGIAELTVSDSGPGVSGEALDSLFERFYRAESSRSRANGGAGLGLALIKALAEAHGGRVSAFRAEEGGLGICVALPAHK